MDTISLQKVHEMTRNTFIVQFMEVPNSLILNPFLPISR